MADTIIGFCKGSVAASILHETAHINESKHTCTEYYPGRVHRACTRVIASLANSYRALSSSSQSSDYGNTL